jgi:hypothetical protein
MSLTLRTDFGCTEAIIDEDCGLKRFYEVANILMQGFNIEFAEKEDEMDTLNWIFRFKNSLLTLHYNIYTGISIYPFKFREAQNTENNDVVEIAQYVEDRLIIHSVKRHLS